MRKQPNYRMLAYAFIASAMSLALVGCFVGLDEYVSASMKLDEMPGDLRAIFSGMSYFGHGTGCLIAALLVWTLDANRKQAISILLGSTILAGIVATIVKILTHRPRPFLPSSFTGEAVSLNDAVFQSSLQSFPSGHTATAFAMAIALSMLYPRAKYVFMSFATLTGIQRVISHNHFPSDVIAGAIVGIWAAKTVLYLVARKEGVVQTEPTIPSVKLMETRAAANSVVPNQPAKDGFISA